MAGKRRYEDGCGLAHALELVGERWALLVVRELLLGPRRFTDLRAGLPGISPNVLSQRLEELERAGLLRRRRLPPPAAARVYELTDWGLELEPIIRAFGRWAARSPALAGGPMSVNSLVLSFRTLFDSAAAGDLQASVGLRLGEQEFQGHIAGGRLELLPGAAESPDLQLQAEDPDALAAVVYGGRSLEEALGDGSLRIAGDPALAARFLGLFPLPERAPAPPENA